MFKLFFRGDQFKIKLADLKFSKIGDGPWFLLIGRGLVRGGRDYSPADPTSAILIFCTPPPSAELDIPAPSVL